MVGPTPEPPGAAPPAPPRLPTRLAAEVDPDIDTAYPDIEDVGITGAVLSFPDARTLTILRSRVTGCEVDEDTTASLDAANAILVDLDLTGRTIEALARVTMVRCRLGGADFGDAAIADVDFDGCVLDLASMRGARLERVRINGGRVDGLDLGGARLTDTVFEGVPLGEVALDGARLERVDLTAADLSGVVDMTAIRGATITETQAVTLSVRLARAAGVLIVG